MNQDLQGLPKPPNQLANMYPSQVGMLPPYNPIHQLPPPVLQPAHPPLTSTLARRRMRVTRACDRCRSQKIKCSGTNPCITCSKHSKECSYTTLTESAAPGAAPAVKRPKMDFREVEPFGLPVIDTNGSEYTRHLENRVQYLESLLSNRSDNMFNPPERKGPIHPDEHVILNRSTKWRHSRRHQNFLVIELCQQMYSSLSEESKAQVSVPRTQYFAWNMSGTHYLTAETLPETPNLAGQVDEDGLINYFFAEVNPLFSILHESVFREQYVAYIKLIEQSSMAEGIKGRQGKVYNAKLFSAILMLCYCISIRMTEMGSVNPRIQMFKLEDQLFKYAHHVVRVLSFEWESFELVQAWMLITVYLRIAYRQTSMYHALGQAVLMCKSMGLGQEPQSWMQCTRYEELKAKRVFWAVYSMERLLGLQSGKYSTMRDEDRERDFPPFALASQMDNWISVPAHAMIQLSRIANFVHTSPSDILELGKLQQINAELVNVHTWLEENGFANSQVVKDGGITVFAQVKLHYYDLVLTIHGKQLYSLVGREMSPAMKITMVLDAFQGILDIGERLHKAGQLLTPWWLTMVLLFNTGVGACCLINSGSYTSQARDILSRSVKLLKILRKSPIRDPVTNKIVVRERFKMAKEAIWAIKMTNHILSLRLQEDVACLNQVGIDHGSQKVNQETFSQLGVSHDEETPNDIEYKTLLGKEGPFTPEDQFEELLSNLQWFDQWGDLDLEEFEPEGDNVLPGS